MAGSILNGKRILAVDDEPDVLEVLQEEILGTCPDCTFDKATTYEQADRMLKATAYDVVILDIMGVRGFDLLDTAVGKKRCGCSPWTGRCSSGKSTTTHRLPS